MTRPDDTAKPVLGSRYRVEGRLWKRPTHQGLLLSDGLTGARRLGVRASAPAGRVESVAKELARQIPGPASSAVVALRDVVLEERSVLFVFDAPAGRSLARWSEGGQRVPVAEARRAGARLVDLIEASPRLLNSPEQVYLDDSGTVAVVPVWPPQQPDAAGDAEALELDLAFVGPDATAPAHFVSAAVYTWLVGTPPLGAARPARTIRDDVPRSLSAAIERGMAGKSTPAALGRVMRGPSTGQRKRRRLVTTIVVLGVLVGGLWTAYASGWMEQIGDHVAEWARSDPEQPEAVGPDEGAGAADRARMAAFAGRYAAIDPLSDASGLAPTDESTGAPAQLVDELWLYPTGRFRWSRQGPGGREEHAGAYATDGDGLKLVGDPGRSGPRLMTASVERGRLVLRVSGRTLLLRKTALYAPNDSGGRVLVAPLRLDAPASGTWFSDPEIRVAGTALRDKSVSTVVVNGAEVELDDDGVFTAAVVAPGDGPFDVQVALLAPGGFLYERRSTVHVDTVPPGVELTAQASTRAGVPAIQISGAVSDDGGVALVEIEGRPVAINEHGRIQVSIRGDAAAGGAYSVLARDEAGNETVDVVVAAGGSTKDTSTPSLYFVEQGVREGSAEAVVDGLVLAHEHGLREQDVPEWVIYALAALKRSAPGVDLLVEYPSKGATLRPVAFTVRGQVSRFMSGDSVLVDGKKADVKGGTFEHEVAAPKPGDHELVVTLVRHDGARHEERIPYHVVDRHAEIRDWTRGALEEEQIALAEKIDVPVGFENPFGMRFVLAPSGEFNMGQNTSLSPILSRRERKHRVRLTSAFYVQITEVTQAQYGAVMGAVPRVEYRGHRFQGDDLPVLGVSWDDAQRFVSRLNDRDPAHEYALPTEAQWEYACRTRTRGPTYYWRGGVDKIGEYANVADRSGKKKFGGWIDIFAVDDGHAGPAPVGSYLPNRWGLFDMLGNAAEWCSDNFGAFSGKAETDPIGIDQSGTKVYRGGSWRDGEESAVVRCTNRWHAMPTEQNEYIGFRVVAKARRP